MNRREFLQCAAILASGASFSQIGFALSKEQHRHLASAANYNKSKVTLLSKEQRAIIAAMTDIVIPRTETPGAVDAGVPQFIELMASDWFNDQEKSIFMTGIIELETRIPKEYGASFDKLTTKQQLSIMEDMEDAASDADWYSFANVLREFISDAPFICQIKELTIWGFFTSEIGATQALRHEPMPMHFDGDIPLTATDSSWAGRS